MRLIAVLLALGIMDEIGGGWEICPIEMRLVAVLLALGIMDGFGGGWEICVEGRSLKLSEEALCRGLPMAFSEDGNSCGFSSTRSVSSSGIIVNAWWTFLTLMTHTMKQMTKRKDFDAFCW